MKVMLTGSTGYIGKAVLKEISQINSLTVFPVSRCVNSINEGLSIGDVSKDTDWSKVLYGVDVVIHCLAAPYDEKTSSIKSDFFKVNVEGTLNLVRQAKAAGVKRFIFLSSIKANGEETKKDSVFSTSSVPSPENFYGESKLLTENKLKDILVDTDMDYVIIRPPAVYGPNGKSNFSLLLSLAKKRLPLPFYGVDNKRSFVFLGNLVSLILVCVKSIEASNQTFLISDGEDMSISEISMLISKYSGKKITLFYFPKFIFYFLAALVGKRDVARRLFGSLQVDISHTKKVLSWKPPFSVDEAMKLTIQD